jgi:hypothetical protein
MASTESRAGSRLPWSTDRPASEDASDGAVNELGAAPPVAGVDEGAAPAHESETSPEDAAGDDVRGLEEETVTILSPDAAPPFAPADPPASAPEPTRAPAVAATRSPATVGAPPAAAPHRRPTQFLADLTRAMQAAAEQARTATLDQFRGDGTAVVEQIHARSATGATELRRRADEDAAAIKDWSKAEIARIRDETERRTAARRGQLESQLERHAAMVEHEIEKVRGRIATFEAEMGQFFDSLVGEDDPAAFAARATSLPEPPSFEDLDDDAMMALLCEPGVGMPEPLADAPLAVVLAEARGEQDAGAGDAPLDRAAPTAAIRKAAEAAAYVLEPEPSSDAEQDGDVDPRLAMLGLTPDFSAAEMAAAEMAAAEMAAAEIDDMPEIGRDALEARLSGLVPGDASEADEAAVTTKVVVTGLVSVASIASLKRHIGRLAGVSHVGVTSGPDAEFVFAVSHDPSTSLRDLIPSIPGFAARVVGFSDGIISVSAQDPRD